MTEPVYITSMGKFLPGRPINNDEMEDVLGKIGGNASRLRKKVLEQNQIHTRYYALDAQQRTTHQAAEMAALAIRDGLERAAVSLNDIELLTAGTTRADLLVPGFASMVRRRQPGRQHTDLAAHEGLKIEAQEQLNYSAITDGDFGIEPMPDGPLNFIEAETAIEIYTPLYQLLLTDGDFWRASHSLQFDETIAIYVSALMGNPYQLAMVNNRHPLVPLSTLRSGFRLMLHGLSSETLHALLVRCKRAQSAGEPVPRFQAGYPPMA